MLEVELWNSAKEMLPKGVLKRAQIGIPSETPYKASGPFFCFFRKPLKFSQLLL